MVRANRTRTRRAARVRPATRGLVSAVSAAVPRQVGAGRRLGGVVHDKAAFLPGGAWNVCVRR